jgi:hypothetical protein
MQFWPKGWNGIQIPTQSHNHTSVTLGSIPDGLDFNADFDFFKNLKIKFEI